MNAIFVADLHKSYGAYEAVRGIGFEIAVGEVFGLLGPNGAGKTTTVEILEGYRHRDAGSVSVLGEDPERAGLDWRQRIGVVLQSSAMYQNLTVAESLALFAGFYERPREVDEVIELVGLSEKRTARVRTLSGGQKRRLDLGLGLIGDPEVLFLDEPTTGFDPNARRNAWEVVKNLTALGKTVFLTTHFMDEAQYLANRVAIIAKGEIVVEGPPETLAGRDQMMARIRYRVPASSPEPPGLGQVPLTDGSWQITADDPTKALYELTGWALNSGVAFETLDVTRPTLEDVYLELTGGEEGSD
jgi:ABC-2 type transport system ATP-binding protein